MRFGGAGENACIENGMPSADDRIGLSAIRRGRTPARRVRAAHRRALVGMECATRTPPALNVERSTAIHCERLEDELKSAPLSWRWGACMMAQMMSKCCIHAQGRGMQQLQHGLSCCRAVMLVRGTRGAMARGASSMSGMSSKCMEAT